MPRAIHQFVPMLHLGDAVGRHTLGLQAELRGRGIESEIYVELEDPETAARTRLVDEEAPEAQSDALFVYQFATASRVADRLAAAKVPLAVNYHNVTPPECFAPWDNGLARHQVTALGQLATLAGVAGLGVAVSQFNRTDLEKAGFADTAVVPPIGAHEAPATGRVSGAPARRTGARWLAVGRIAPNKALEDAIAALLAYRIRHDPQAELTIVGKPALGVYADALRRYAVSLGLGRAVHFRGKLGDDELVRAYGEADVLVVTSVHEGFCLPVVEAMASDLPVVAYRQGALPEVLGSAGVLLDTKHPLAWSDAVRRLQVEEGWRSRVVEAGRTRLPELGLERAAGDLADLLTSEARFAGRS